MIVTHLNAQTKDQIIGALVTSRIAVIDDTGWMEVDPAFYFAYLGPWSVGTGQMVVNEDGIETEIYKQLPGVWAVLLGEPTSDQLEALPVPTPQPDPPMVGF